MQDKDHDSSDEEDRSRANITAKLDLQVKSFLALGQAWPSDQCTQGAVLPYSNNSLYFMRFHL